MAYNDTYDMNGDHSTTRYYNPETGKPCSYEEYFYITNRIRGYSQPLSFKSVVSQSKQQITQSSIESKLENTKNKLLLLL